MRCIDADIVVEILRLNVRDSVDSFHDVVLIREQAEAEIICHLRCTRHQPCPIAFRLRPEFVLAIFLRR